MSAIKKLLIANRGEIACRIMKTARARGIATVAVFSDADAGALHGRMAGEAICIGGSEAAQSYLNIEAVIGAAKASGADAVHPGYGFLSERADFARACTDAGLIFVGPPAEAIAAMGDKAEAKARMIEAGVPCVPGYQGEDQSDETLLKEAEKVGFPVMVKASAGGGGRGMRIVEDREALADAIQSARKEAKSAFGDDRLIIERAVTGARHVEIQILADAHGSCVHLGERDCSLQRRNQKVIEEAPSPVIGAEKREEMGAAAVKAAQAVGYAGAGTVEFLYDPARDEFYFLEMNTRLQVEHPVTEMVTGLDLVDFQLSVAEGDALPFEQGDIDFEGHAIEARLYAEDPAQGFMPHSGKVRLLEFPEMEDVRIDAGVEAGDIVTTFYDPMIAKVIAYGATRDEARMKLAAALRRTKLLGFEHNRDFLIALLGDEAFAKGEADTGYIERNLERLTKREAPGGAAAIALAGAALTDASFDNLLTGWASRRSAGFPLHLVNSGGEIVKTAIALDGAKVTAAHDGAEAAIEVLSKTENTIRYRHENRIGEARYARNHYHLEIDCDGAWERYTDFTLVPASESAGGDDVVKAPMAGLVTSLRVGPGDPVSKGTVLATIEAMKMEHQLKAPRDGVVADVFAKEGDQVAIRAKIVALKAEE
ncbi:acetyl/propionyl/methylcrotonyl-CoA carboxylase subunit alpha [Hyphococcus luteus]|uniref:3-methylcrotonyl-CoA carboxylase n=1 Tax=Hyphococcus luteus TaxID=2058213 RepID=A0A2S7K8Y6_9PROT|nr:acetyl-CoA carboxylase biotin carboxylase subunit [Marinicaulis flavus]PQA88960.1 3-methylcrotonyl-CoA carboxylase [Marinicaulis flavus]